MGLVNKIRSKQFWPYLKNIALVIFGCLVLALGDVLFIVPNNLVTGGVASIGIIAQYFYELSGGTKMINDIVVAAIQVSMLIVAFLFVSKKFALHTLLASLAYPAFYSLFIRINIGQLVGLGEFYNLCNPYYDSSIGEVVSSTTIINEAHIGYLLLAGIFGGVLVGAGVGLALLGDGSTGGMDVLGEILYRKAGITHNASSFAFDTILIVLGLILLKTPVTSLVGVVSAFSCALGIRYVYGYLNSYEIVQIISDKYQDIQKYIHEKLEHASTEFDIIGGYSGTQKRMIQVVIYHREISLLRRFIASVDPNAFVTYMTARTINGDGFMALTPNYEGVTLFRELINKLKSKNKKK